MRIQGYLCALVLVGLSAPALAGNVTVTKFKVADHPNGGKTPPPYGLRFDNLFAVPHGQGGTTTFSFGTLQSSDTYLTVTDATDDGGVITININGTLHGGVAPGSTYTWGEGDYALDYTYRINVVETSTGWETTLENASNNGTLTALGNYDAIKKDEVFSFQDKGKIVNQVPGYSFRFQQDDHRLTAADFLGDGLWVGRGWQKGLEKTPPTQFGINNNVPQWIPGTHDFLFVAQVVPLPPAAAAGLAMLGLMGLGRIRRRLRRRDSV